MILYMVGLVSVLLCFCGLMHDVGYFEVVKLRMQAAADAAAIGAVYAGENGSTFKAGGLADATLNGYTTGVNHVTVRIASPPTTGAYAGMTQAVQATITRKVSAIFFPKSFTLMAQATAMAEQTPCMYLLSQYSTAVSLNAINQTITGNCPVYMGNSYDFNGGSSDTGDQFYVASPATNSSGSVVPAPYFGAPTMADPLAYVPSPPVGGCTYVNLSVTHASTLFPGTYCGGLSVQTSARVVMNAGVYAIQGNLNINGPTLVGTGITLYMTSGNGYAAGTTATITNINGKLSAPDTGTWQGILYFADRSLPSGKQPLSLANWNPTSTTDGIFYLLGQQMQISNLPLKPLAYLGIVADNMSVHNTGFTLAANYTSLAGGNPFRPFSGGAGLVE